MLYWGMRVLGNHHSLPWSKILLASLAKFPFSKICSLRSQIFRFLHASSVSAFAHFVRDMFAKSVRFAHRFSVFYMHLFDVFSLTSFAIRSLRSLFCVCVFARFARDLFASLTFLCLCFPRFARNTFAPLTTSASFAPFFLFFFMWSVYSCRRYRLCIFSELFRLLQ